MLRKPAHLAFGAAMLTITGGHGSSAPAVESGGRPSPEALAQPCRACHADKEDGVIPRLDGQPEARLVARMRAFREGRPDSVMHRIAQGYCEQDYASLARYFSTPRRGSR